MYGENHNATYTGRYDTVSQSAFRLYYLDQKLDLNNDIVKSIRAQSLTDELASLIVDLLSSFLLVLDWQVGGVIFVGEH